MSASETLKATRVSSQQLLWGLEGRVLLGCSTACSWWRRGLLFIMPEVGPARAATAIAPPMNHDAGARSKLACKWIVETRMVCSRTRNGVAQPHRMFITRTYRVSVWPYLVVLWRVKYSDGPPICILMSSRSPNYQNTHLGSKTY
jgi:hypothetical protein